uniref:Uncharacterized protein n=1 Tax=Oryza rufipogon TaxID=4529 RepID=A0A0E0P5M5_ORYRU
MEAADLASRRLRGEATGEGARTVKEAAVGAWGFQIQWSRTTWRPDMAPTTSRRPPATTTDRQGRRRSVGDLPHPAGAGGRRGGMGAADDGREGVGGVSGREAAGGAGGGGGVGGGRLARAEAEARLEASPQRRRSPDQTPKHRQVLLLVAITMMNAWHLAMAFGSRYKNMARYKPE